MNTCQHSAASVQSSQDEFPQEQLEEEPPEDWEQEGDIQVLDEEEEMYDEGQEGGEGEGDGDGFNGSQDEEEDETSLREADMSLKEIPGHLRETVEGNLKVKRLLSASEATASWFHRVPGSVFLRSFFHLNLVLANMFQHPCLCVYVYLNCYLYLRLSLSLHFFISLHLSISSSLSLTIFFAASLYPYFSLSFCLCVSNYISVYIFDVSLPLYIHPHFCVSLFFKSLSLVLIMFLMKMYMFIFIFVLSSVPLPPPQALVIARAVCRVVS